MKRFTLFILIIFSATAFAAGTPAQKTVVKPVQNNVVPANGQTVQNNVQTQPIPPQPLVQAKSYERYTEMFAIYYSNRLAKVVMMGDSITQGAYWNELLQRGDVINRGIPGDTTQGMLERLETLNPGGIEKAFMLMGINDLAKHRPVEEIFGRYVRIIEFLVRSGIKPHIQSTLYLSPKNTGYIETNKQVAELNRLLKDYAVKNRIDFIDLNAVLSDGKAMVDDYTYDGTHLNAKGYIIWRSVLANYLEPMYEIEAPVEETATEVPAAQ